ncbi:MAG: fructose-1,6-bisphosphatase [Clostridiaceae bacterium]|jgi:fructose-1,6-bisphosphatase-3|nr:fructose-1,6-bisphosphatase [Clostridiaceae bacterium]
MNTDKYLQLLAKDYPNIKAATAEIIHLNALKALPKGTEYFFSDLHGEDKAFVHLLRSASGNIRTKISELFANKLTTEEQNQLANLVYDPTRVLQILKESDRLTPEWIRIVIFRLVDLCHYIGTKSSRENIARKTPQLYYDIITELLFTGYEEQNKKDYIESIVRFIIEADASKSFIIAMCNMIQNLCVNSLHILGDIFDRGPGPHRIMEELINFPVVDIQWGNHDILWMGAAAGNEVCMTSVLRIGIGYNNFDALEDGYDLNLRPLSSFAEAVYGQDECARFQPKILDKNEYDQVDPTHAARMHKAISIIQFKLEGQLLERHPEYEMNDRIVLKKVDFERGVYKHGDKEYPLLDTNFPTIDPKNPLQLTEEEKDLMRGIRASFLHSEPLQRHIRFLYSSGSMYKTVNNNLLFHGCIPLREDGSFDTMKIKGKEYGGKALLDQLNLLIQDAYFLTSEPRQKQQAEDLMWYLWSGHKSPLFGKSQMSTFENFFVEDRAIRKEHYNPYFTLSQQEEVVCRILTEFGLDPDISHIINGHVPVKIKDGESPIKANGKLYVIDGGIAKAYQPKTGIAGYTLIFNSHHLALAQHHSLDYSIVNDLGSYTPTLQIVEEMPRRLVEGDTDLGREWDSMIADLEELIRAYRYGRIKEQFTDDL